MDCVIALDAGTTSVRAFVYDLKAGTFVHRAQQEVGQSFPKPGWVEQDANEIWYKAAYCLNDCIDFAGAANIAGIGIANQRETVVAWDRQTGAPVCPAIVWQCRRTSKFCSELPEETVRLIRERTGLLPDAYFSASKMKWILDNVPAAQRLLREGRLCLGTVDSYLLFRLTEGKSFCTDHTNASRTMLFDIHTLDYDGELLERFGIPRGVLPDIYPCDARFGEAVAGGARLPVAGIAGDQQAALIGQAALSCGDGKITYGTGLFLLFHTGEKCVSSDGLLSTVAYTLNGRTSYALEGSVFHAGSAVQWLRDGLEMIPTSAESERIASSVPDSGGVAFVPAFTGLGAPHWNSDARAMLCGITRGTTKAHIVRAVLESIACGARELLDCMERDSGVRLREIKCDGGASANGFLMQLQANILGVAVNRPSERESTALGAAFLAAVSLGEMGEEEIARRRTSERIFTPARDRAPFEALYRNYLGAVKRALYRPNSE